MITINEDKLKLDLVSTLPEAIALAFGDPISKTAATVGIFVKGLNWFKEKNKDWWESYITGTDLMEFIDDHQKSAEYMQFIRGILNQVAYETSETKREYCKKFALNYPKMIKENSFSEVMHYKALLERLSEGHLKLLVFMSNFKHMSGGKEWYAPFPPNTFDTNVYGNGPYKDRIGIPMTFIEPIVSDLTSFGILEKRKDLIHLTFMGMHFVDYLVK